MAERITQFYRRAGWIILTLLALSLFVIAPSAVAMLLTMRNDVKEWLPAGFQETIDLIWFAERFGSDEILVVSWPGCTLEDGRLPQLAEKLAGVTVNTVAARGRGEPAPDLPVAGPPGRAAAAENPPDSDIDAEGNSNIEGESNAEGEIARDEQAAKNLARAEPAEDLPLEDRPLFKRIFHGSRVADQLQDVLEETQSQMSVAQAARLKDVARERMSGWLLGPDGHTTCAVALVSRTGEEFRHSAVEAVYQAAEDLDIPRDQLRVGGSTTDSVAIDKASFEGMPPMIIVANFLGLFAAWIALRRVAFIATVFLTAIYCWLVCMALMYWAGLTMNSILIMVPVLVHVLSVSGSIHLINYYLDACRRGERDVAIGRMVADSFAPCVLAAMTTAIGMGSLGMSELVPIKNFGIWSAISTLVSLALFYLLLPSALTFFHMRRPPAPDKLKTSEEKAAARHQLFERFLRGWVRVVIHAQTPIVLCAMLLLGLCILGALEIQTAVKLKSLFPARAEVIRNYSWLEENLGPLVPVEVVLRFPAEGESSGLQRLQLVSEMQRRVAEIEGVGGTVSTATFAPEIPTGGGVRATIARSRFNSAIERRRAEIVASGYLVEADDEHLWRVSARVPAMTDEDYGVYLARLRETVEETLAQSDAFPAAAEAEYIICGGVPLFSSASQALLRDLQSSFFSAFMLIGLAMFVLVGVATYQVTPATAPHAWWTILWRSFLGSALSMIPNVFPILLIFGAMGALRLKVDIGAMMTASVALGIAVDDTLHFLTWFQRAMMRKADRRRAVLASFHHCAKAMIQTTLVCSLGLFAFSFSEFIPTARFAWLMCALLVAALFGDMIVLPGLLVSSLGAVFKGAEPMAERSLNELPEPAVSGAYSR